MSDERFRYEISLGEKVIRLRQALGGMPDGDPLSVIDRERG